MVQAEIICTGTELLRGEVLNTHLQYLGRKLTALGIEVVLHVTVGDDWSRMRAVLSDSLQRSDLIVTTGGLGPTTDDLTKETVAEVLGLDMYFDEAAFLQMKEFFRRRGAEMPDSIAKQAYFPVGSRILPNPVGTAPGVLIEKNEKIIVLLPGPPVELQQIFESSVIPFLQKLSRPGPVVLSRVFKLTGISELAVQDRLRDLGGQGNPGLAYVAKPGEVHVRITARGNTEAEAQALLQELAEKVRERVAGYIFGTDDEVLEEVVGRLLKEKGLTLAIAESCTGGMISSRLTDVPGSSQYFMGTVVAYDNRIKESLLQVPAQILATAGAVSRETAVAMAEGVRRMTGADLGLAVTGIAGPGGGSAEKPVGLVYIALTSEDGTCCREFRFPGMRVGVRRGAVNAALNMVRLYLLAQ